MKQALGDPSARPRRPVPTPPAARPAGGLGLLPWIFPGMLLVVAVDVVASGRDLTAHFAQLQALAPAPRPPLAAWVQRAVSLLLVVAAVEQVANHLALRRPTPAPGVLAGFVTYWLGAIAAPALFGAHPEVSHELLYAPAAGIACCLVSADERARLLRLARDALLLMMAAGLLLAPLQPTLVMDPGYADGLLPGVPRLAGLAPHPVGQGQLALVALLLLWACPYERRWLRRGAWGLALAVLLLAQSKTVWVALVPCVLAMAVVRRGAAFSRRLADPHRPAFGVGMCLALAALTAALALWVLSGQAGQRVEALLASDQGAQLLTLTGRDRIWTAAAQEWQAHPVFGYGLSLWDAAYRASIGLPQATHAHNQFLDDAARAGTVGVLALGAYAAALLVAVARRARTSGGLAPALALLVVLRAVSEVPLSLLGYGTELFTHLLLLVTLAGPARAATPHPRQQPLAQGVPA